MDSEDAGGPSGPEAFGPDPGPVPEQARMGQAAGDTRTQASLLDPGVLEDLEEEVPGAATGFARAFIGLWDQRRARLAGAVRAGDRREALEAALSLKASAMMVGATRLAGLAAELELSLARRDGRQEHLCDLVGVCGADTMELLRAQPLVATRPGGTPALEDQPSEHR